MSRVLIINGFSISERNGTGITLTNLWELFDRNELSQLVVSYKKPERECNIRTVCTPENFCKVPYGIYKKRNSSGMGHGNNAHSLNGNISQKGLKNHFHDALRGLLDDWPINYRTIDQEINEFNPEVIYTCGASIRVLKVANHYAKKFRIPIVLHLMDDWPRTIYTMSILSRPFRFSIWKQLNLANRFSIYNLAISEALSEKYEKMYGKHYTMLMNPATKCEKKAQEITTGSVSFIYAGSLSLNRWKSLYKIACEIQKHREKGQEASFDIYAPDNFITEDNVKMFNDVGTHMHRYVTPEELRKIYLKSNVMVFTESFDENVKEFISLSLSTKIPDYFSSGRLMLAYVPSDIHSSEYLKKYKSALVANTDEELKEAIDLIFRRDGMCYEYAANALTRVAEVHSQEAAERILRSTIDKTVEEFSYATKG